ncbi:MAG: LPS-assembly protein LptD [Rhodocyclaceae bacterium]|nr:LPS-assembly protein LptD [Rhodocyclaceae bacterium]
MRPPRLQSPVGPRLKRLPLLLFWMSGSVFAAGLGPLEVSPDLIRPSSPKGALAPVGAANSLPPRPKTEAGGAPAARPVAATPAGVTVRPQPAPPAAAAAARVAVPENLAKGATWVEARSVSGVQNVDMVAEGDAVLVRDDLTLRADRLTYQQLADQAEATGNVRLERGQESMQGPRASLQLGAHTGEFDSPAYTVSRQNTPEPGMPAQSVTGSGHADKLYFEGENQYRLTNATWSTCKAEDPDWYIRAQELKLDYDRQVGEAQGGAVVFKDVPLLYMPWADFPLANQRQSGFLSPTFGTSTKTGLDLAAPYYWNIAPNYDATLTPRFMGRRGVQMGGEFRYLTPGYKGETRLEWLPEDRVAGGARAAGSIQHSQVFMPGLVASVNLNRVSDSQYFEDLSTRLSNISQSNLVQEGRVSYSAGGWWDVSGLVQSYQTLSGTRPYRRMPQLSLNAHRAELPLGVAVAMKGEYTQFEIPDQDRPEGSRTVLYPQISLPLETAAFSLTPKLGVHHTQYSLDRPLDPKADSLTRTLPIATLDGAVVFERDWSFGGRNFIQTLEPRLYYVYIPYEKQNPAQYPIFDSGYYDFNFAQIFSENIFAGSDRIANANQLTAAVTSRLIDPATGAERLKAAIGQRYYFEDQRVLLNASDVARSGKRADIVAAFGGRVADKTTLDTGWQYNPRDGETERFNFDLRWQPEYAKALGLAWRYKRNPDNADPLRPTGYRDIDITGQWPFGGGWYGVGRFNRSLLEHRTTEAIAGLEYDGGCWVVRTALHRYVSRNSQSDTIENSGSTTAFFVQLELNGLSSLGSSPLTLLRRSVPGYGKINDTSAAGLFGANE